MLEEASAAAEGIGKAFSRCLVKGFNLSYHIKETILNYIIVT